MADFDELERLARAATPGKWYATEAEDNPSAIKSDQITRSVYVADALESNDQAFIAAANPETILALLSANREMREEPRVLAITLEGMQGEPAGMMTVGVQMTDGQKFDLIRTNGTVISHWARLPDAEARSALTTQRGDGG